MAKQAWIDHIARAGRTFVYTPTGIDGLVSARTVIITARGSDYRAGTHLHAFDFQEPYLRAILGFLGITDLHFVHADSQGPTSTEADVILDRCRDSVRALATGHAQPVVVLP